MFFEIHPVLCPGFLVLLKMAPKSSSKVYVLQNEDKSYLVVFLNFQNNFSLQGVLRDLNE